MVEKWVFGLMNEKKLESLKDGCGRIIKWLDDVWSQHTTNKSFLFSFVPSSIHPFIYLSINPSIHPSIPSLTHIFIFYPFIYSYIQISIYPCIHPSVHQSIHPSINSSTHPLIHPPIHQSIHPSINPSIHPSIPSTQIVGALSIMMDMKKGAVNETVKENRADELSAMFNMLLDQKLKKLGGWVRGWVGE